MKRKRISYQQAEALKNVRDTGNFGLHDKWATKQSLTGVNSFVHVGYSKPLELTHRGVEALERFERNEANRREETPEHKDMHPELLAVVRAMEICLRADGENRRSGRTLAMLERVMEAAMRGDSVLIITNDSRQSQAFATWLRGAGVHSCPGRVTVCCRDLLDTTAGRIHSKVEIDHFAAANLMKEALRPIQVLIDAGWKLPLPPL